MKIYQPGHFYELTELLAKTRWATSCEPFHPPALIYFKPSFFLAASNATDSRMRFCRVSGRTAE